MNIALLIGKKNSLGVPGKNIRPILGRPAVSYSLMAAKNCRSIDKIFVSTDCPEIKNLAKGFNATIIDRPTDLSMSDTPTEKVFEHAYSKIKQQVGLEKVEKVLLLFANSVDILPDYIEEAISKLDKNATLDSVVSISKFNMFSPLRARKMEGDKTVPMLDLEKLNIKDTFNRDAMGDCYFIDFGIQLVRPDCLVNVDSGALPFKWLGHKIGYIEKDFGFDIDCLWQIPALEYWLKEHGFTEKVSPYSGVQNE